jgi:hypothetical protein
MDAGGTADGLADGLGAASAGEASATGSAKDRRAAAVAGRRCLSAFFDADTVENVPAVRPAARQATPSPGAPRPRTPAPGRDTGRMKLSRPVSWFLLVFGVWSWIIWVTFAKNLFKDGSGLAFDDAGDPTAYFWVHLLLAIASFVLGTIVGLIGLRSLRVLRRTP